MTPTSLPLSQFTLITQSRRQVTLLSARPNNSHQRCFSGHAFNTLCHSLLSPCPSCYQPAFGRIHFHEYPKRSQDAAACALLLHIQEVLEFKLPVNSILKMEVAFWTEGWSQCGGNLNMQLARLDRGRWKNKNEICAESPQTCVFCTLLKQGKLHTNKTTFKTWAVAIIRTSVQVSG